jgi:hypothetical protein
LTEHVVRDCLPVSCEISFCCTHTMRLVMSRPQLMSQTTTARRKLFFFSFHLRLSCRHLFSDLRKTSLGTLLGVVRAAGLSSSWPLQLLNLLHASSICKCFPLRQTLGASTNVPSSGCSLCYASLIFWKKICRRIEFSSGQLRAHNGGVKPRPLDRVLPGE